MRKLLLIAAATAELSAPAFAAPEDQCNSAGPALATGAVVGTVAGVAVHEGWIGGSLGASLPASAAGAAVVGGVVGVGVVAGIDAVTQPCRGFHALFGANRQYCAQQQAGYDAQTMRVSQRRVVRR